MKPLHFLPSLLVIFALTCCPFYARANDGDADPSEMNNAQMDVRINALEEQIRALNGRLEESQFQNRKLAEDLEKFRKDTEFRFSDIAQPQPPAAPVVEPTAPASVVPQSPPANATEVRKPLVGSKVEVRDASTGTTVSQSLGTPAKDSPKADDALAAQPQFANARDHYNYAFRLLNQTKYDEASAGFKTFLKKYPKDPLAGNANYWLGETFYIKKDYANAADNFRQGFEASPSGPKAADNLLKLAMSLDALKQSKQACAVLGQVVSKFGKTAANAAHKAETEQKRIGCQ